MTRGEQNDPQVTSILTQKHALGFSFAENWLKNAQKWLGELIVEVILSVNANVVLYDIYRILRHRQQHRQTIETYAVLSTCRPTQTVHYLQTM